MGTINNFGRVYNMMTGNNRGFLFQGGAPNDWMRHEAQPPLASPLHSANFMNRQSTTCTVNNVSYVHHLQTGDNEEGSSFYQVHFDDPCHHDNITAGEDVVDLPGTPTEFSGDSEYEFLEDDTTDNIADEVCAPLEEASHPPNTPSTSNDQSRSEVTVHYGHVGNVFIGMVNNSGSVFQIGGSSKQRTRSPLGQSFSQNQTSRGYGPRYDYVDNMAMAKCSGNGTVWQIPSDDRGAMEYAMKCENAGRQAHRRQQELLMQQHFRGDYYTPSADMCDDFETFLDDVIHSLNHNVNAGGRACPPDHARTL